jgi:hypothetical protein
MTAGFNDFDGASPSGTQRSWYRRNNLAQLCRGFLLLQGKDEERARTFLVVFLVELAKFQAQLVLAEDS